MSTPGYEIDDLQALASHQSKVTGVSDLVNGSRNAGNQVGLGGVEAYGLLCSPLMIPALQAFQGDMDELLGSAADLAGALSDGIKRTITDYSESEQNLRSQADQMGWER